MEFNYQTLPQHKFIFSGNSREYFKIWFSNIVLTILTLGIYSAWATVRRRGYFYRHTSLAGKPFDYHADPVQILTGRIIMVAILFLFTFITAALPLSGSWLSFALLLSLPWLMVRSWRFQARMSSYDGVRFGFTAATGAACRTLLVIPLLLIVLLLLFTLFLFFIGAGGGGTAGLTVACILFFAGLFFVQAIGRELIWSLYVNNHCCGDIAFSAALEKKAFLRITLMSLLILLPFFAVFFWQLFSMLSKIMSGLALTPEALQSVIIEASLSINLLYFFLLVGFWVSANYIFIATRNYVYNRTRIGSKLCMKCDLNYAGWMKLLLGNALLIIVTLGLATPLAQIRRARFMAQGIWLEGELPEPGKADEMTDNLSGAVAGEFVPVEGISIGINF